MKEKLFLIGCVVIVVAQISNGIFNNEWNPGAMLGWGFAVLCEIKLVRKKG